MIQSHRFATVRNSKIFVWFGLSGQRLATFLLRFYCSASGNPVCGTSIRTKSPVMPRSPVQITKYENPVFSSNSPNPIGINSVSSSNSNVKAIDTNSLSPRRPENEDSVSPKFTFHVTLDFVY